MSPKQTGPALALCMPLFLAVITASPLFSAEEPSTESLPSIPEDGATIVDCYDTAVANLEKVCEDYRRIKALELSKIRDIAFLDAHKNIQSVMPILKPVNRDLLRKRITNPDDIAAHKKEVEKVEAEVENMVELITRLLTEIEIVQQKMEEHAAEAEKQEVTLAEIVQSPDYDPNQVQETTQTQRSQETNNETLKQLAVKAAQNPEHRAVDVSSEMQALSRPESKEGQERKELKGTPVTAQQMEGQTFKLKEMKYDVGRKVVSEGGAPVEWMFVDTWYTIGPFPNPQRINLNTKFPPETIVNLSATYPGKNGKIVGWEFLQTNKANCVPLHDEEYAIYYAYTELWFDEAVDLWIAIGSDDKANVWINNLPVWVSSDQLKVWRIDEGLRKVHFQKGVNKILYRVENGWKATSFSLGVQVKR